MFKKVLKLTAHFFVAKYAVQAFDQLVDFVVDEWQKKNQKPEVNNDWNYLMGMRNCNNYFYCKKDAI